MELLATTILYTTYKKVNLDKVIIDEKYLTKKQQKALHKVLTKVSKLFDRTLVINPQRKVHIELLSDAISKHARSYSLP